MVIKKIFLNEPKKKALIASIKASLNKQNVFTCRLLVRVLFLSLALALLLP